MTQRDLRHLDFGKFDVIFSFAVIYCVPDDHLTSYFKLIMNSLNPQGAALIGCSSNYSMRGKIVHLIKWIFPKLKAKGAKQIGWVRDIRHVERYMPKDVIKVNFYRFDYLNFNGKNLAIR